jgi:hypothetical protein
MSYRRTLLQEHLFLQPAEEGEGVARILNPMLSYFAPVLITGPPSERIPSQTGFATPEDLAALTWARGPFMKAPSRRAFAREEASWRDMLVSQPPISRLDWWHEWIHDKSGSWPASSDLDRATGWGHQYHDKSFVTLGMLWDLVESRLTRGCTARVQFFLDGMSVDGDTDASEAEKSFIAENNESRSPYRADTPRVKISTRQVWSKVPWARAGFDGKTNEWITMRRKRANAHAGDGFNLLREDCSFDRGQERWSKSDGFRWAELKGETSAS